MRRALAVLRGEGLITTEQGRGAFVRLKPHVRLLVTGAVSASIAPLDCPASTHRHLSRANGPSSGYVLSPQ